MIEKIVLPTGRGLTDLTAEYLAHNCVRSACIRCHGGMFVDWRQGEWVHQDGWTRAEHECTPWDSGRPFWLRRWETVLPKGQCCYLIHFDRPYEHATHYIGWAKDLGPRLTHHAGGTGANLMRVVTAAGIGWELARVWPGGDRQTEIKLKAQGGKSRMCPLCGVGRRGRSISSKPRPQRAAKPRAATAPEVMSERPACSKFRLADWPPVQISERICT
jgi:hypothetical protein